MTDNYYVEISHLPRHGTPPVLVPLDDVDKYTGFRSVYAYPEITKDWILNNEGRTKGSVIGLAASKLPVFTDRILVDIDDDPASAEKWVRFLTEWNISHGVWDSGGRSTHIHIVAEPKCDYRVPYSQKKWLRDVGQSIGASFDASIYHSAGLFRLPNTIHTKTGRPKTCIGGLWGSTLDYDLVDTVSHSANTSASLESVWRLLLTEVRTGGRNLHVYKITSNATALGWDVDKILTHVYNWNAWQPKECQLSQAELEAKVYANL